MTLVEKEGYSQNKMENMDWLNETDQIEGMSHKHGPGLRFYKNRIHYNERFSFLISSGHIKVELLSTGCLR